MGTQEQYPIGDLSGKLLWRNNETDLVPGSLELRGEFWDIFLPLQGRYSVIHRSFIIYKYVKLKIKLYIVSVFFY